MWGHPAIINLLRRELAKRNRIGKRSLFQPIPAVKAYRSQVRYAILKEVNEGSTPLTEDSFGVSEGELDDAVHFLSREKYLVGVSWAENRPHLHKIGPSLTEQGEQYLKENSLLSYKGLKEEAWEWIKL